MQHGEILLWFFWTPKKITNVRCLLLYLINEWYATILAMFLLPHNLSHRKYSFQVPLSWSNLCSSELPVTWSGLLLGQLLYFIWNYNYLDRRSLFLRYLVLESRDHVWFIWEPLWDPGLWGETGQRALKSGLSGFWSWLCHLLARANC